MAIKYTNNARSRLSAAVTSAATTVSIDEGDYGDFLAAATGDMFAVLRNANSREIIKVSITNSSAADGLDVQRGQDGSTATTFPRGSVIYQAITATNWEAFYQMGDYTALASTTDASTYFGENRYDSTATKWYKSTSATGTTWVATCT